MSVAPSQRPRSRGHLGRAEIAISARGVVADGLAQSPATSGVNLDVVRGQVTAIAGPPGSGKTALLRVLAGLDRPREGVVWIGDRYLAAAPGRPTWRFRRDQLVFVGAEPTGRGGGTRVTSILRALAPRPELAFIDEPAGGLAPPEVEQVRRTLADLTAAGSTAIIATSDPEVATWGERLLVLERGALTLDLEAPTSAEAATAVRAKRASRTGG